MLLQEVALKVTKNPDDLLKLIRRDCGPFLSIGLQHPMYRGLPRSFINSRKPIITLEYETTDVRLFKMTRRHDRQPTGTHQSVHDLIDELFDKEYGWKARSSGVFAAVDYAQASGYGVPFAFFPIGNFRSLWSSDVYDLFTSIPRGIETLIVSDDDDEKIEGKLELRRFFNTLDYRTDLKGVDGDDREVMFDCDSYYLIDAMWNVDKHPVLKELFK